VPVPVLDGENITSGHRSYEQFEVPQATYEDKKIYMKDGDSYRVVIWDNDPIDIKLPIRRSIQSLSPKEASRATPLRNL
jgi:hypothetical protein